MIPLDRLRVLQAVVLTVFALLALQLARMQLTGAETYGEVLDGGHLRVVSVEPPRGLVFDRNGRPLARNIPQFSVVAIPGDLPVDEDERRSVLLALELETRVPYGELEQRIAAGLESVDPLSPVTVRTGLDATAAITARAALAGFPGVRVEATPVRRYDGGDLLAQILGYVGPITPDDVDEYLDLDYPLNAQVGRSGVESSYEARLRGSPGRKLVRADASGRELDVLGELAAESGADLTLSIDLDLQAAVSRALSAGIEAGVANAEDSEGRAADRAAGIEVQPLTATGAAVVMDVRSGELLALVSLPAYEANIFSGVPDAEALSALLENPARPLVQRAYMEVRSPGSTFKPVAGMAALQEGIATPETRITSTGAITVRDEFNPDTVYVFRDWAAHGTLDFYGGIVRSSDVYYYYLSGGFVRDGKRVFEGLGPERLADYARASGLGDYTGLDLPGEAHGLVPDPSWKADALDEPWVLGDTYTFGIGQGYLAVTPLQMAVATAAIANGGDVLTPHVVQSWTRDGVTRPTPRAVRGTLPVDAENIEVMREALRRAATRGGTAVNGKPDGVAIGGKTGTAEFGVLHVDGSFDTHGWFLGFAPFDEPTIAVVVYLQQGVGSTHAAPVARAIFEAYFGLQAQVQR